MKLYHYVHCPFCVRVRMGLGFLKKPFESVVVSYDDEITPVKLTGKKMLPIVEFDDGVAMNESLDILRKIDEKQSLNWSLYETHKAELESWLNRVGEPVHSLAMPYWIWTPEFNQSSREYFQKKKEVKRGPFKNLVQNKEQYENQIKEILSQFETKLKPFYQSENLTIIDIMIASHLWGLYIVPEFQFPLNIHHYLQNVKSLCHFNYHQDFWK